MQTRKVVLKSIEELMAEGYIEYSNGVIYSPRRGDDLEILSGMRPLFDGRVLDVVESEGPMDAAESKGSRNVVDIKTGFWLDSFWIKRYFGEFEDIEELFEL